VAVTVDSVYEKLITQEFPNFDATSYIIWHKQVPSKVSILTWRLLQNRLPTKDNLVARDIIYCENQLCVTDCGDIKTAHHLFLSSPCFDPFNR